MISRKCIIVNKRRFKINFNLVGIIMAKGTIFQSKTDWLGKRGGNIIDHFARDSEHSRWLEAPEISRQFFDLNRALIDYVNPRSPDLSAKNN